MQRRLDLHEMIEKGSAVNDKLEAIAKEKHPDREPQSVLQEMIERLSVGFLRTDMDYKTKLDAMAADLGEHFAAIRTNPDFQNIFENWRKDYSKRQYDKMCSAVAEWSGNKVTAEEVSLLMKASTAALEIAGE